MFAALFLTDADSGRLLQADVGTHDDGVPVLARAETVPAGPGVGGEAIFTALYLAWTSNCAVTLDVTPIITGTNDDGTPFDRELETQELLIDATPEPMHVQREIGLSDPFVVDGVELGRFAPRATWFRTRIVALVHTEGDFILQGLGVEMEVVRESLIVPAPTLAPPGS